MLREGRETVRGVVPSHTLFYEEGKCDRRVMKAKSESGRRIREGVFPKFRPVSWRKEVSPCDNGLQWGLSMPDFDGWGLSWLVVLVKPN